MPSPRPQRSGVVAAILDRLEAQHPNATTELNFRTAFELLVATILSAQSTDRRVNEITPALFAKYPDAATLAKAAPEDLEPLVEPTGFFRVKSRNLVGAARALVAHHGGDVPADMGALVALPGVGRKTANVVLGHAFGVPGLPVDRHVLRVTNRLGIARSDDAVAVEKQLTAALPPERWTRASDTLILHGRRVCRPKPLCDRCSAREMCAYVRRLGPSAPRRATPRTKRRAAVNRRGRRKPPS
jgi:endonuclease-3